MFGQERYTEKVRNAFFFARYESSRWGTQAVEPEHILLGLIRADPELFRQLALGSQDVIESIRSAVVIPQNPGKPPTDIIPLSPSATKTVKIAIVESERLGHDYIGTEHLLLGLLLTVESQASNILGEQGFIAGELINRFRNGSITPQTTQVNNGPVLGSW